jgi:hypothetical protein
VAGADLRLRLQQSTREASTVALAHQPAHSPH